MGVKNGLTLGQMQDWAETELRAEGGLTERLVKHLGWEKAAATAERAKFVREQWSNSLFKKFFAGMLKGGIYLAPSAHEAIFISLAHSKEDIEKTVQVAQNVFNEISGV